MNNLKFFFGHSVARNNSEQTERSKIIFQFVLMLIASILCGVFFVQILSDNYLDNALVNVSKHFNAPFKGHTDIEGILSSYLSYCFFDICCIVLIYIFSFSFISYAVTDITIAFCGFRFGMGIALLWQLAFVRIGFFNCGVFVVLRLLMLVVLLIYSYKMAFYSLRIRISSTNGRAVIFTKGFFSTLLFSLSAVGVTLIIDGLYCLLIYIF